LLVLAAFHNSYKLPLVAVAEIVKLTPWHCLAEGLTTTADGKGLTFTVTEPSNTESATKGLPNDTLTNV
jgi:hypothetical protein